MPALHPRPLLDPMVPALALVGVVTASACLSDLRFVRGEGDFCDLDTGCGETLYCSLETNECLPRLDDAQPCAADQACLSGACENGVCCVSACPGACRSCSVAGSVGQCVSVPEGQDPLNACPGTTSCSANAECQASVEWSLAVGDQSDQHVAAVEIGPKGDVLVAGTFRGTLNFETGPLQNPGEEDSFVARIASDGETVRWAAAMGGSGRQVVEDMAVDDAGNVYVAGWFTDEIVDGNGVAILSAGDRDGFVAALDPDGALAWVVPVAGAGDQRLTAIAATSDSIVVGGSTVSDLTMGTCLASASATEPDALLLTMAKAGFCTNMRVVGSAGAPQTVTALAVADGAIFAAVTGRGEVDYGAGAIDAGIADLDVWITSLGFGLSASWTTLVEGVGDEAAEHLTPDGAGGVWVTGSTTAAADPKLALETAVERDVLLAHLDETGAETDRRVFGGPYDQVGRGLVLDGEGNLFLAGDFELGIDVGDDGITTHGGTDVFVARLTPEGSASWSLPLGSRMNESVAGIRLTPNGGLVLAFDFEDRVVLGVTSHRPEGARDILVTELDP